MKFKARGLVLVASALLFLAGLNSGALAQDGVTYKEDYYCRLAKKWDPPACLKLWFPKNVDANATPKLRISFTAYYHLGKVVFRVGHKTGSPDADRPVRVGSVEKGETVVRRVPVSLCRTYPEPRQTQLLMWVNGKVPKNRAKKIAPHKWSRALDPIWAALDFRCSK